MGHCLIGQERLGFASETRSASSLDGLAGKLDWDEISGLLVGIHANAKGEAAWPPLAMFKAHVGADADTALVEEIAVTPANINDGRAGPDALPGNPGEVFADSAYRGSHFRDAVRAKGGVPRIVATGMWGRDEAETLRKLHEWNQPIHRVRGRIEKIFGTWKRSYGLRRMRWRGIVKAACQIHLTAIAYNLKRTLNIMRLAG